MTVARRHAGTPEHLLMLSGGLDSAWCLRHLVESGLPVRTHHVTLRDWEGRASVEDRAVTNVLRWAKDNGHGHLITHSRSTVDFGDLRWIPKNFHLWAYWAGVIMANPANAAITKVVLPRHSDAFTSPAGAKKSDTAYKTHIKAICGRTPELVFPMVHLTKAEVVRDLPADLREACWWCRRPRNGKPCHNCMTCRQVDPALEGVS